MTFFSEEVALKPALRWARIASLLTVLLAMALLRKEAAIEYLLARIGDRQVRAALEIYKQQPRVDEIERVSVSLSDFAYRQQIAYPQTINTREHADHSVPYVVARALLDGAVGVNDFEERRFKDPRAIAVMKRITLRSEPSLSNVDIGAKLEAVLRGGAVGRANVPIPPGSMTNPPDDASLSRKFLALAEPVLGRARAQAAIDMILSTETLPNLGKLVDAVTPKRV
jgi:2-methylcitrate dehydratase